MSRACKTTIAEFLRLQIPLDNYAALEEYCDQLGGIQYMDHEHRAALLKFRALRGQTTGRIIRTKWSNDGVTACHPTPVTPSSDLDDEDESTSVCPPTPTHYRSEPETQASFYDDYVYDCEPQSPEIYARNSFMIFPDEESVLPEPTPEVRAFLHMDEDFSVPRIPDHPEMIDITEDLSDLPDTIDLTDE